MSSNCIFQFDRPSPIYYTGETINGTIQLTTAAAKNVREVYILFEGHAKVRWEERKTRTRNNETQYYTEYYRGNEVYLNSRNVVYGSGTLPIGLHTYSFSIFLPLECPTSCVEQYGRINYELSLVLNRPFRFDNVFRQPVTVIRQLNLNLRADLLIPIRNENIKYFCCWPCSSGPVISVLSIPFGGYAPGQSIRYTLEVDNQLKSHDLNDGIQLSLLQIYKFTAHTPHHKTRYQCNTLATTEQAERVLRLIKRRIEGELLIPAVPPTSEHAGIITVSYLVRMTIKTSGCHRNQEIDIPITIGTMPLAQSAIGWTPSAPPLLPEASNDLPPSYENFNPPSYQEATVFGGQFIDIDVDERNRFDGFVPKYPMYTHFEIPNN